jgi:ATP-dependent DNA helicase RecG
VMAIYSETELELLMSDLESDLVERKESAADGRKIRRNICAFANDLPGNGCAGVILVGIRDDGSCAALTIDDELLKRLADIHGEGDILPLPTMTVQKRVLNGCAVAVVTVEPAPDPPVRYRGRAWIRVGPSVREAGIADERMLGERRRAADLPFDMRPAVGVTIAALDLDFARDHYLPNAIAREVLDQNERPLAHQLQSLRLVHGATPTWAAVLSFGSDPQAFVPGAYVQFLRIDGAEITDPIRDQKQLTGRLDDVLRRLDELLELNISVRTEVAGGLRERRRPDYPLDALRQLAHNAVMHRTYEGTNTPVRIHWFSDRVEIASPGGLFGRITPENFGMGDTDYRNPLLVEIMHHLGFAQRFGLGVRLARQALAANGNPPPEFDFQPTLVVATVRIAA